MPFADKDSLRIPYPAWAKDGNVEDGDRDFENWKELQRWADRLPTGGVGPVIDVGDGAVPTGHTKAWYFQKSATLIAVTGVLSVPGSTDTIANVLKNGSVIDTMTIPASALNATITVSVGFNIGDLWQMQITSSGTGAGGLTFYGDAN